MSELKIKSDQNLLAAELLKRNEFRCFAASVHCSYYSCLQFMAYVIISKELITRTLRQEQSYQGKGSHKIIRNTFEIAYAKQTTPENFKNFKEWVGQLQQNRIESDYFEDKIDEPKSNISRDLSIRILSQLKKIYK